MTSVHGNKELNMTAEVALRELITAYDAVQPLARALAAHISNSGLWGTPSAFPRQRELGAAKLRFEQVLSAARRLV